MGTRGFLIAQFLANEADVEIRDWSLLATRDDASFLTYKITIKVNMSKN